jgi:transmembrane sensor
MGLGVTVAVIATAVVGLRLLGVSEDKPTRLEYQTPLAINRDIALPDGSSVVLGAESELKASFTASFRRVELSDGEAYFKVEHDEQRPFYVRAGNLTIRDVGTAFDVSKTGQRITVTVAQGHVRVTEAGSGTEESAAENTVDIVAGQQVLYSPGMAGLRVARVDPADALGWREQRLQFVNEPLAAVIANINRYAQHPLKISDPAIDRLSFTGTVDLHSLDRWLAALQTIFPVRVEHGPAGDAIVPITASHHH